MKHSSVSSKGQIVIPKVLREQLDWRERDDVVFYEENSKPIVQALPKRKWSEILAQLLNLEAKTPYNSFEELFELEKRSAREQHQKSRADR